MRVKANNFSGNPLKDMEPKYLLKAVVPPSSPPPASRDQEGRRGSEEVVPESLGVPLQGDRYVGEICGSHQGCQVPF